MYHVIIIEDDPMVASINRQYVEATPAFQVDRVFKNGVEALEYLKTGTADLIILDYYTPVMNGDVFIDSLRVMGKHPDIIMVTSANDTDIVRSLISRGVIDYLVKPFEYLRFRSALEKFAKTREYLANADSSMDQKTIDRLLTGPDPSADTSRNLTKGLNENTMNLIRNFLKKNPGSFTSEQIAERLGLSRITIRRYMNYLVDSREIISVIDYKTGGRPSIKYSYGHNCPAT
jgi:CitB family two-component system response regulator MalR/two-component system response regulator DctR